MNYQDTEVLYKSFNSILTRLQNYALYFYTFSLNMEFFDPFNTGGNFSFAKLSGLIYFFLILISYDKYFVLQKRVVYFLWPLWVVFLIMTINGIAQINFVSNNFFHVSFFLNLIMFYIMINHGMKNKDVMDSAMMAYALGAVLVSLFMFFDIGVSINSDGRTTVFGSNYNELGIKSSLALIILVNFLFIDRLRFGVNRYWFLVLISFLLIAIIQAGSRSALVSLILSLIIMIVLFKGENYIKRMFFYVFVFTFLVFGYYLLQNSEMMIDRLSAIGVTASDHNGPLGGRLHIWKAYSILAIDHWIIGLGLSGFEYHSVQLFGVVRSVHNVLLEIMLYTGIVGLSFLLLFIFRIMRSAFRVSRYASDDLPMLFLPVIFVVVGANQMLVVKFSWMLLAYIIVVYLTYFRFKLSK